MMAQATQKILGAFERYYPKVLSLAVSVLILICLPKEYVIRLLSRDIIGSIFTTSSVLFGFLLTVLALVLQSDTKAIRLIREKNRFGELIGYNKSAVITSFVVLLVSLILLVITEKPVIDFNIVSWKGVFQVLWLCATLKMLFDSYRYIDIFYALIGSE